MRDSILGLRPGVNVQSPVRNRTFVRFTILLLVSVFGFSFSAVGQQATIVGTVTDPAGAALPNVNITVTNRESGVARSIQTNTAGQYVVPDLNIGHYNVKAQTAGFKAREQNDRDSENHFKELVAAAKQMASRG